MQLNEFDIEHSLGSLLGRTTKMMGRLLEAHFKEAGYEFTLEHWLILTHLWKQDGQIQNDLGWKCGRDKTAISRAINWLETKNYVLRVPDQSDKRNKRVYLTQRGKDVQQSMFSCARKTIAQASKGIPEQEMTQFKEILQQIFTNLTHCSP